MKEHNEREWIWVEAIVAYCKEILHNRPGKPEENQENLLSGQLVPQSRFELRLFRIQVRSINFEPKCLELLYEY
jgi:hypothetical protein